MMYRAFFKLTQGMYWLFLGMWLGAIVMLIFAAVITFKTVPEYEPTVGIEPYNHEIFSDTATQGRIIAGGVTRKVLQSLGGIELVCGLVVLVCLLLQCTVFSRKLWPHANKRLGLRGGWLNWLRIIMVVLPLLNVFATANMSKRMWTLHEIRYDAAQVDADRAKALHEFDTLHKRSERMTGGTMIMLLAVAVISSFVLTRDPAEEELG